MNLKDILFISERRHTKSDIDNAFEALPLEAKESRWYPYARQIAEIRHASKETSGTRLCIFCMPKSGSSFVQKALVHTLGIPFVTLNRAGGSFFGSELGINPREQELDELAIIQSNILFNSYISQHHTRAHRYLDILLASYKIIPIVVIRNIADCMISLDDMMMDALYLEKTSEQDKHIWFNTGGKLSLNYTKLNRTDRHSLLIDTWAKWYVEFFVSWTRLARFGVNRPCFISYDDDILGGSEGFKSNMADLLDLNSTHKQKLAEYCLSPDKTKSRINKGIKGRGVEYISKENLERIYRMGTYYKEEISNRDFQILFGSCLHDNSK